MSCSLRLTQEFYGLARDFGIVARELGRDGRRECLRASQRVWSFDLALLVLVPKYSAEHPLRHTVSAFLLI
jgi:hypothetical protein